MWCALLIDPSIVLRITRRLAMHRIQPRGWLDGTVGLKASIISVREVVDAVAFPRRVCHRLDLHHRVAKVGAWRRGEQKVEHQPRAVIPPHGPHPHPCVQVSVCSPSSRPPMISWHRGLPALPR